LKDRQNSSERRLKLFGIHALMLDRRRGDFALINRVVFDVFQEQQVKVITAMFISTGRRKIFPRMALQSLKAGTKGGGVASASSSLFVNLWSATIRRPS